MKYKKFLFTLSLVFIPLFLLSGCEQLLGGDETLDTNAIVQTSIAQTQAAMGAGEVEATTAVPNTESIPPTETVTPTITQTATETLTPTLSNPQAQVDVNTNCRRGPGELYDIVGALVVGQIGDVVGRYQAGDYWVIENPTSSGECWIWGYYATIEGPLDSLPYYTQPPTPTPAVNWTGTWTTQYGPPGGPYYDITVILNQTDSNINGSFTFMTTPYTVYGTLSTDYMTFSGTWDNGTTTGPLLYHWLNPNQFNGNEDSGTNAWCGYRNSAGMPSPCLYP